MEALFLGTVKLVALFLWVIRKCRSEFPVGCGRLSATPGVRWGCAGAYRPATLRYQL